MKGATLRLADLHDVDFSHGRFHGAYFESAQLSHVTFTNSVLDEWVAFDDAVLDDVQFTGATVEKAALEALSATLAKEERDNGIHVNVVAPGLVETDMGLRLARAVTGDRSL